MYMPSHINKFNLTTSNHSFKSYRFLSKSIPKHFQNSQKKFLFIPHSPRNTNRIIVLMLVNLCLMEIEQIFKNMITLTEKALPHTHTLLSFLKQNLCQLNCIAASSFYCDHAFLLLFGLMLIKF